MPSQKNIEYVQKMKERLEPGKAFYFTDFKGISVKKLEKLRKELKKNGASYLVIKNSLGHLAMKDLGFDNDSLRQLFIGPTGIAIAFDDPIILAKILSDTEDLKIKGGIIEGAFFDAKEVLKFSRIPSRDILLSNLAGSLNLLGNLANTLESIIRDLIFTVESIKSKEVK
jgi:large subunit ribosomal protein L10